MSDKRQSKKQRKKRRKELIKQYYKDNPPETYNELLKWTNASMKWNDGDIEKVMDETDESSSVELEASGWRNYYESVVDKKND